MRALTLLNPYRPKFRRLKSTPESRAYARKWARLRRLGRTEEKLDPYSYYGADDALIPALRSNPPKKRKPKTKKNMAKKNRKSPKSRKSGGKPKSTRRRKSSFKVRARRAYRAARKFGRRAAKRTRRAAKIEGRGIASLFKSVVSKDNIQTVGGIALGTVASKFVMRQFGASLPMSSQPIVNTIYQVLIPVALGTFVVRRFAPRAAEGMVLSGLLIGINSIVNQVAPQLGFGSYVDATAPQPVLPYPTGALSPITGSVDSASRMNANLGTNTMAYSGIYDSPMPFQSDAWSN